MFTMFICFFDLVLKFNNIFIFFWKSKEYLLIMSFLKGIFGGDNWENKTKAPRKYNINNRVFQEDKLLSEG